MREYKRNKTSKAFLNSESVCWGRMENCVRHLHTHTDTHCIYLVSTRVLRGCFDCSSFPREISEVVRWGVSISDPGSHLEVFRGERTQIHNESPRGLPRRAQSETPIINMTGGKSGGERNCVHVCSKRKKRILRQRRALLSESYGASEHYTLLRAPRHHFPSRDVCCNIFDTFRHFWAVNAPSP